MPEELLTVIATAVITGAATRIGERVGDDAMDAVDKECEAGWKRDKEAGGFSSWEDDDDYDILQSTPLCRFVE
ncbi:hypothetical protein MEO40_26210 [Dolichospermum sp. ST_sed1]|nr:hypothetical protein [Dolichospermum sp. ST_sed1]MDD1423379.1 hypothetical protein [Dolichospermum sp. ST_sed9]MDD1430125.1 hypothetical protein [Dolichospermum sp. ST_sed6]MDD1439366.1 hypothetical protein [Dolichospermum sp. ST_sed3]MDD1445190.1 hypothetical protein [Dolichospermum sp. ST_sed8]MDD1458194.1 hypothetical protein [Dolichospermum sp. ST_sed7]MDD1459303.1 hypothetical protein [Dolichospermum sp. ST_sed2]MDD1464392.1 hypothetical protein [Dolichospermum sp. ST_sed5]MDD147133